MILVSVTEKDTLEGCSGNVKRQDIGTVALPMSSRNFTELDILFSLRIKEEEKKGMEG